MSKKGKKKEESRQKALDSSFSVCVSACFECVYSHQYKDTKKRA
jgi:hypothetical protein